MALRLMEIHFADEQKEEIEGIVKDYEKDHSWYYPTDEGFSAIKLIIDSSLSGDLIEKLDKKFSSSEHFRLLVVPLEASLPRIEQPEQEEQQEKEERFKMLGVSIDEIYTDVSDAIGTTFTEMAFTIIASIVGAIGLIRNNVAIVVGAMVIAPILGPNVGLSLGTVLGDTKLSFKALRQMLYRLSAALIFSIFIGYFFEIDATVHEISSRTFVNFSDIVLALASGLAGALVFTSARLTSLIGVMVSVALLPPLVIFGILLGNGNFALCAGALLLFAVNVTCINLASVLTFRLFGIRPRVWWKEVTARKGFRNAALLWTALLVILAVLILIIYK
ncbi:MAG: TIGR00341 family protein [Thermotogota bacterium]|nr:TIGR00341 family protein [Thermotogota bacterium]